MVAASTGLTMRYVSACTPPGNCRVDNERIVTNRPLAGTRRRGVTPEADKALEQELLADQKEVRGAGVEAHSRTLTNPEQMQVGLCFAMSPLSPPT